MISRLQILSKKGQPEDILVTDSDNTCSEMSVWFLLVGVANKESDYSENDKLQLTLLMDSVWNTVRTEKY